MAVGNTFGATALSSYGGFWIATAIILTPGGFEVEAQLGDQFNSSFGLFLMVSPHCNSNPLKTPANPGQGWFIFTFILVICTLKSTVAFFLLFFFLDMTFLLLAIGYLLPVDGSPNTKLLKAGGLFGFLAAFAAWYNALAGIADNSNSFFIIPVAHFPWSPTGRSRREKTERELA
jgi:succinate-acetate transporter protein